MAPIETTREATVQHLYEFDLQQIYYETGQIRLFQYQIPAESEREAVFRLGQTFYRDAVYQLRIVSVRQVW